MTTPSKDWSAKQYLKFNAERTRPARDLLLQVPLDNPKRVMDLGCGPGNSTAVLQERFPDAKLSGMDSSPDMIRKAKETLPGVAFEVGDLKTFEPDEPVDLFFSNAVFQWLSTQERLDILQRLMGRLATGGALAFQVPDNLTEPSHVAMQETANAPGEAWTEVLSRSAPKRDEFQTSAEIYDALIPFSSNVDIWRTTYYHIMKDHQAIVEWVKGTGLRPYLDPLGEEEAKGYLASYLAKLKEKYPAQSDGQVLLAYPRLFVVAVKK